MKAIRNIVAAVLLAGLTGAANAEGEIYCPKTVDDAVEDPSTGQLYNLDGVPFTTEPFMGQTVKWRALLPGFPRSKGGVIERIEICSAAGKVVVSREDDGTARVDLHVRNKVGEQRTGCRFYRQDGALTNDPTFCDPSTKVTDAEFNAAVTLAKNLQEQIIAPEVSARMLITFK